MKEDDEMLYGGTERRQWHLDKTVSISHILTTVIIAGSMAGLWFKMDTRIALLEQSQQLQMKFNEKQELADKEIVRSVKESLDRIDAKLDRIIWEGKGKGG